MNDLISIIVPIYGVEKYLEKCVNSIIDQTYKNIEIILVDDGSPDNCGEICDQYATKDNRIKVIHKNNEGVSVARNTALEMATGHFIMFVDADDELEFNCLEMLLKKQKEKDFDFVVGACIVLGRKKETLSNHSIKEYFDDEIKDNIFEILSIFSMYTPWGKLYKRNIIQNNLSFMKNVTYGEDAIFVIDYLSKTSSVGIIDDVVYRYNCKNLSCASQKFHPNICEYNKIILEKVQKFINPNNEEVNKKEFQQFAAGRISFVLEHYLLCSSGVVETLKFVKKTMQLLGNYTSLELLELDDKLIQYLKDGKYISFVLSWRISNTSRYCRFNIKKFIKQMIIKFKFRD